MEQTELNKRISNRLHQQVAFRGMTQRKTVVGEIILKCPIYNNQPDLDELADDIVSVFIGYIAEATSTQIKNIIKSILE